jgi:hypothetical protein
MPGRTTILCDLALSARAGLRLYLYLLPWSLRCDTSTRPRSARHTSIRRTRSSSAFSRFRQSSVMMTRVDQQRGGPREVRDEPNVAREARGIGPCKIRSTRGGAAARPYTAPSRAGCGCLSREGQRFRAAGAARSPVSVRTTIATSSREAPPPLAELGAWGAERSAPRVAPSHKAGPEKLSRWHPAMTTRRISRRRDTLRRFSTTCSRGPRW